MYYLTNSSNINIGKKIVKIIYNDQTMRLEKKKLIMILRNYQIK